MQLSGPISLIKQSFNIFFEKKNLIFFLKIYAILVPFFLYFLYQDSLINIKTTDLGVNEASLLLSKFGWLLGVGVIVNLAYLVISFWVGASGIMAVSGVLSGTSISVREVFSSAWKRLWPFSLLSILAALIVGLGFILLIIPGIIFMVWFRFSSFELITNGKGVKDSLSGSKKLVAGRFWAVLGRLVVISLFSALAGLVLSAIPFGLGGMVTALLGALFMLPYFLLYRELSGSGSPVI
jgi:hypothetical protein